jgi:type II secretory pathway pseudopilin PulG
VVLGVVLLITIVAVGIFATSASQRLGFNMVRQQASALERAKQGAETTMAKLRSTQLTISTGAGAYSCVDQDLLDAGCTSLYFKLQDPPDPSPDPINDPNWYVRVYRRQTSLGVSGVAAPSVVINSVGFSGPHTSPNRMTAVVEIEVQLGLASQGGGAGGGNDVAGGS